MPRRMEALLEHFATLDDPRCPGKISYPLSDILVIAVCAVIAGAESYEDLALYGRSKQNWLAQFLGLSAGIPSHDTFRRVFMLLDAEAFEACFLAWAASRASSLEGEVVAIDGKTLRRSFDRRSAQSPLHVVSAWATDRSLVLAPRLVEETSNEITALPSLLDALARKGALVTIDAMGCQKQIAGHVLRREADYLLVGEPSEGLRGRRGALRVRLLRAWGLPARRGVSACLRCLRREPRPRRTPPRLLLRCRGTS